MAHQSAGMAMVESRAEGLGERVGGIDDTRDMLENDCTVHLPFLDGKVLDIDMA